MQIKSLIVCSFLAAGWVSAAHAQQGVNLASGYTDFTTWTLQGSAAAQNQTPGNGFTYSLLNLTAGSGGESGTGFAPTALTMDFNQAFRFDFHFQISAGNDQLRGDGLTFAMSSAPFLGNAGSGLGYENAPASSVAFAIDTFHFGPDPTGSGGEPVSPSLQILQGGNVTPLAATETGMGDSIRDRYYQWYATVNYTPTGNNAGTLIGYIENLNFPGNDSYTSFAVSAVVDFGALGMADKPVYYGFTASNGLATDAHMVTSAVPVPEPETYAMMLAGLGLLGFSARRRKQKAA